MLPAALALLLALVVATPAPAQITGVTALRNPGNTPDEVVLAPLSTSYERESTLAITAATAAAVSTRYTALVTLDPSLFGYAKWEGLDSDYNVTFSVTAPGAYRLVVTQRRRGDLHLIEDNVLAADHYADMTALTGTQTGGTLVAGTLDLADPGRANDIPLVFDPITVAFNQTATATIFNVSNGSPKAHTLRFVWNQIAFSPASGDQAAIRMGGTSDDPVETAGDYPGNPARVRADDGHMVDITLVSLCGNGVIDGSVGYAEACDDGAANGTAGSCCNTDCTLRAAGTSCRAAAGACDNAEVCNGVDGACPMDSAAGAFVVCRPAAGACDVAETCDGVGNACPPDAKSTAVCRAASGACDVAESCNGVDVTCPADLLAPNGAACSDGDACSTGETCTAGVCGGGTGGCGACERCETGGCVVGPRPGCRVPTSPGTALLQLKNRTPDTGDLVSWKWTRGAATTVADLGLPLDTTDYTLCVFDQGGTRLVLGATAPAGGLCAGRACWKQSTKGFGYKDKDRTPSGLEKMSLTAGTTGKAKVTLKGKGPNLALPALGLTLPVRVQLQASDAACFEATYSSAQLNTSSQLKARSD